jgi:hypothetical protein
MIVPSWVGYFFLDRWNIREVPASRKKIWEGWWEGMGKACFDRALFHAFQPTFPSIYIVQLAVTLLFWRRPNLVQLSGTLFWRGSPSPANVPRPGGEYQ